MKVVAHRARRRRRFEPSAGRAYVPSDLRVAVRRARRWRKAQEAGGLQPAVPETGVAGLLRRGRASGLLGRGRRQRVMSFRIAPRQVELATRVTGARSLPELMLAALVNLVLEDGGAPRRFADRRPGRIPGRRQRGPSLPRGGGQGRR